MSDGLFRAEWTGRELSSARHTLSIRRPSGSFVYQTTPNNDPVNLPRTDLGDGTFRYGLNLAQDISIGSQGFVAKICVDCPASGATNCTEVRVPGSGGPGTPDTEQEDMVDVSDDDDDDDVTLNCLLSDRFLSTQVTDVEAQSLGLSWQYSEGVPGGADELLVSYRATGDRGPANANPDTLRQNSGVSTFTLTQLTPSTTYEVTTCLLCQDGSKACKTITAETGPWDCPTEARLLAGVTVEGIAPDGISVDWRPASLNADPAMWTVDLDQSGTPQPLAATPGAFVYDGLAEGSEHVVTVCHSCAETGERICADFPVTIPACDAFDLSLAAGRVDFNEAVLEWSANTVGTYRFAYTEQGGSPVNDNDFFEVETNSHTLSALEPLTSYEVVVCSPCGTSEICDTTVVTTTNVSCELAGDFEYSYECGPTGPVDPFENEEAITFLNAGDSVWAGDFLVEVSVVEGSGPQFNGYGYAKVPYLNGARVKVNFQQIEVNDNCRMIGGEMVLVSPITEALLEIQGALAEILDVLGDINTVLGNISSVLGDVTGILNDVATSADVTDEALAIIDQTAITLTNVPYMPDSLVQAIQDGADCLENAARPAPGDDAEVRRCRDQTIAAIAAAQAFVDALFDAPYAIDFTPTDRIYGFDQQPHPLVTEDYPQRTINDQPYLTPWISTSTADAQGTALRAVRADGQPLPSDVSFIEAADVASEGWTNNGADATHPGLSAGGDQQTKIIFASIPNPEAGDTLPPVTLAGQANLVTYSPVVKTVHVVPVNGATVPLSAAALRDSLNKYYRPAVASWNVVVQPNLEVLDFDGELSDIPNSLLSNYTGEMAQLRSTVKSQSYHDEDALYLIVVPSMEEAGRLGYMPRKRRFGFLTAAGNADPFTFARTAAHELAHGAFHLQHVYDRFGPLEPGNTDNLMDSGLGTALYKYQWDNVHDPESNFTLFDEEGEGESVVAMTSFLLEGCTESVSIPAVLANFIIADAVLQTQINDFVRSQDCSNGARIYALDAARAMMMDNEIRWDRSEELYFAILNDDDFLMNYCSSGAPNYDPWTELVSFKVSGAPKQRIDQIQNFWNVQDVEDALGANINLDYYPVEIESMPYHMATGIMMTPEELFDTFRLEINKFAPKFDPYEKPFDENLWVSNNPLSTIMQIRIIRFAEYGDVICSQYVDDCCWVFTTLNSGPGIASWGGSAAHPVSGNRQFGIHEVDGKIRIFTKGADRAYSGHHGLFQTAVLNGGRDFWIGMQGRLRNYITSHNGTLTVPQPDYIAHRPLWDDVKKILTSLVPLSQITCD